MALYCTANTEVEFLKTGTPLALAKNASTKMEVDKNILLLHF